jgi:hypothetical protein
MFPEMLRALPFIALATFTATLACSLVVSYDPDNRPCGADDGGKLGSCLTGYSCQVNVCVADRSVERGRTCTLTVQCTEPDVCPQPGFVCRQPCTWAFGDGGQCDGSTVCIAANDFSGVPIAVCTPTDDTRAGGCATSCPSTSDGCPLACVQIKSGQGHCMTACALACSESGCTDGCDNCSTDGVKRSCQPVGPNENLVCAASSTAASPPGQGQPCNFLNKPCAKGFACWKPTASADGVCRSYCKVGGDTHCSDYGPSVCEQLWTRGNETFGACN